MAERPEDLSLPASVVTRIVKEAVINNIRPIQYASGQAQGLFMLAPCSFHLNAMHHCV